MTPREAQLADYCRRSIAAEPRWHYKQFRPMNNLNTSPDVEQTCDCSTHATCAYHWCGAPDPNHENYSGYGYTGTLVSNPKCGSPYKVGDLGIYGHSMGDTTHVVTCYSAGDAYSALWASHGSESGPYSVKLYYRSDLVCVVRPGLGGEGEEEVGLPNWYYPWASWYLTTPRDPKQRPDGAPDKIPEWAWDYVAEDEDIAERFGMTKGEQDWIVWYLGGKQGARPDVPQTIPHRWWDDAEYVQKQRQPAE